MALSSTESEFIALTEVARETLWIQPILQFLGFEEIEKVTIIFEDNIPTIHAATNQQTKGRTKHLSVKVRFVSKCIDANIFKIHKVDSKNNPADMLTKAQGRVLFFKHRALFLAQLSDFHEGRTDK